MELIFAGMVGGGIGIAAMCLCNVAKDRREKGNGRVHAVYLLRFDSMGKVEIKTAPAQLWNWKY